MGTPANALSIDDDKFLVASVIERCPKLMMLRELVQNAIDAARFTVNGRGRIWIEGVEIEGIRKLAIRNTGPGMDKEMLRRMSDISASIGKLKGLNDNFGIGGKVASLPSNHLGVRFRSCAGGRVFEIVLGKFDGVYSRLLRGTSGGELVDVVETTELYDASALQQDWTEVVLLGHAASQDTTIDPHGGDPIVQAYWAPQLLYHRFLRIPENVEIEIGEGLHWFKGARKFETISQRWLHAFGRHEAVETADGTRVHYIYDPSHAERPWENLSSEGALQSASSFAAVAFRGELYDLRTGSAWIYDAPKYGISFAGRHISMIVELPDDFPVLPDMYRQFMRHVEGEQDRVEVDDFVGLIGDKRPEWLKDIFAEIALQASPRENLLNEFKHFRRSLGLLLYEHVERPKGSQEESEKEPWVEPELQVVQLDDEQDIKDRWLDGRAACYFQDTHQLFVNCKYEAILELAEKLKWEAYRLNLFRGAIDTLDLLTVVAAREAIIRRLGRTVLYGLSKRADSERWNAGHIEKSISPEALSVVADEWRDLVAGAMDVLNSRLGAPSFSAEASPPSDNPPANPAQPDGVGASTSSLAPLSAPSSQSAELREVAPAVTSRFRVRKLVADQQTVISR